MATNTQLGEALRISRDLIADPEHWTQGSPARKADGSMTEPLDTDAYQYCVVGAMVAAANKISDWRYDHGQSCALVDEMKCAFRHTVRGRVGPYNDSHTHAEVLAALEQTIAFLAS